VINNGRRMANAFRQGEHICVLYDSEDGQISVAAEYLADGFRQGRRCFFVGASPQVHGRLRESLSKVGIDAAEMSRRTALVEGLHADVHLANGGFNTERMLGLLSGSIELALNEGFSGLRSCGDMTWLLNEPSAHEQVVEYEALLNELFRTTPAEAMCLYDRQRLPSYLLGRALATHSSTMVDRIHKPNRFFRS
jgi:hypothetical protein